MKSRHFIPAWIFAGLIVISASVPNDELQKFKNLNKILEILLSDYILHFFAFGIFAGLFCYGYYRNKESFLLYLKVGLLSLCFGFFIEIYQIFLPYRSFDLHDIASDCVGIVAALLLFKLITIRRDSQTLSSKQ